MNFEKLPKIEKYDFYIDIAFKRAKEKAEKKKTTKIRSKKDKIKAEKDKEITKIREINKVIGSFFNKIIKAFPSFNSLPVFYLELTKISLDYELLKKSLGAVNWAKDNIEKLFREYSKKINSSKSIDLIKKYRQGFYGRASSIVKQISDELMYLDYSRKILRKFPDIKEDVKTTALVGFPNVGKSTLLKALTNTNPEIKDYAFTTKNINVGYIYKTSRGKKKERELQIIDVPGTFDRPFDKMNNIEKQSYLIMKHVADKIIFVVDGSDSYAISKQINLLRKAKKEFKKNIVVAINKIDITKRENIDLIKNEIKGLDKNISIYEISGKKNIGLKKIKDVLRQINNNISKT